MANTMLEADRSSLRLPAGGMTRRRGSALVLVMTLLGILFVAGVALLTTVNFEAGSIRVEQEQRRDEVGLDTIGNNISKALADGFMLQPGIPGGSEPIVQGYVPVIVNGSQKLDGKGRPEVAYFIPSGAGFADLPSVNPLLGQIEPFIDTSTGTQVPVYAASTNLKVLYQGPDESWNVNEWLDASAIGGAWVQVEEDDGTIVDSQDGAAVDADGDGFVDSRQYNAVNLGFARGELSTIRQRVNDPASPEGEVYLGMRIIAHGGMVNVNESHPFLVDAMLDTADASGSRMKSHNPPYSSLIEEPVLRLKGGLVMPRVFPPARLHGSPYDMTDQDIPGGGDFSLDLFPAGQTIVADDNMPHRFWKYDPRKDVDQIRWPDRLNPDSPNYDKRHLLTTASWDDQTSRGARVETGVQGGVVQYASAFERMFAANQTGYDPEGGVLPFELANYPQSITNIAVCTPPTNPACDLDQLNARKGRLKLSLSWLDTALASQIITKEQMVLMIQDAFLMLLTNAQGVVWSDVQCSTDVECPAGTTCDSGTNYCIDPPMGGHRYRLAQIERQAAMLTANLVDHMDEDNEPTQVAVRSFDFTNLAQAGREILVDQCVGGPNAGQPCTGGSCGGGGECMERPEYYYGIERQPYLTEVAVSMLLTGDEGTWSVMSRAIELFNPYGEDISSAPGPGDQYLLAQVDPSGVVQMMTPLVGLIRGGENSEFTVFYSGTEQDFGDHGQSGAAWNDASGSDAMIFEGGWTVYLVRRLQVDGETVDVVIDQMLATGSCFGNATMNPETCPSLFVGGGPPGGLGTFSIERNLTDASQTWNAPVGTSWEVLPVGDVTLDHTLGTWNTGTAGVNGYPTKFANEGDGTYVRPVEVRPANTGSFSRVLNPDGTVKSVASVPTVGSMLLPLRYANRELGDAGTALKVTELSFTSMLAGEDEVMVNGQPVVKHRYRQIDNGRMPVFDEAVLHHVNADLTPMKLPGEASNLPWGQLVFDYFTLLPLSSDGPYVSSDPEFDAYSPANFNAIPRVDQDGLRVHGRISLNAAPWKVLAGLPLVTMDQIPAGHRQKVWAALYGTDNGELTGNPNAPAYEQLRVGEAFAKAIVAYREERDLPYFDSVLGVPASTGDFGQDGTGRGWEAETVSFRRGPGLLSVGELFNVRHPGAGPLAKVDSGYVTPDSGDDSQQLGEDFVAAAALMIALNEWATVRSNVFTVYGTFRGDVVADSEDPGLEADARALRFQETIDRLPMYLGRPTPARIGERMVTSYSDITSD